MCAIFMSLRAAVRKDVRTGLDNDNRDVRSSNPKGSQTAIGDFLSRIGIHVSAYASAM